MKKLIISFLVLMGIVGSYYFFAAPTQEEVEGTGSLVITKEDIDYIVENKEQLISLFTEQEKTKEAVHMIAEVMRELGYDDTHEIIMWAKDKWMDADSLQDMYEEAYAQVLYIWEQKQANYPVATYVWEYLKGLGYNDYVCAGILGNMMAECGGQTFNLNPNLYSTDGYYGICQWSPGHYDIMDASLEEQCDYLAGNIEYEFNTFGDKYKKDFDYEDFLQLTDAEEAALAFAKSYERCNSKYYKVRLENALKAYEYFAAFEIELP